MLTRSLPRVARTSTSTAVSNSTAASAAARYYSSSARFLSPSFSAVHQAPVISQSTQTRSASAHAISNPTLAGIEKRWESMPPQEQAELWMQLRDRMKVDWNEMTMQEKKAAWWIAFGPHGPRAESPPGEMTKIWLYSFVGVGVAGVLFYLIHSMARPPPRSMTKEWQEATNEYLRSEKSNPIYGISSEGYEGKGHVQSKSAKSQGIKLEPDE